MPVAREPRGRLDPDGMDEFGLPGENVGDEVFALRGRGQDVVLSVRKGKAAGGGGCSRQEEEERDQEARERQCPMHYNKARYLCYNHITIMINYN